MTTPAGLWGSKSAAQVTAWLRMEREHHKMAEGNVPSIRYPETALFLGCSAVAEIPGCGEHLQGGET